MIGDASPTSLLPESRIVENPVGRREGERSRLAETFSLPAFCGESYAGSITSLARNWLTAKQVIDLP
jgi:hypothetical protein